MALRRKDISICPTQHGVLFLGILIAMLLGSINYNNNGGFILVFLLGTMAVISLFHSYGNLLGIKPVPLQVQPVFTGQTIIFPIKLSKTNHQGNARGQPTDQALGQALFLGFKDTEPILFSGDILHLKKESAKRGYLTPGDLVLTSVYPFGLFRLKAVIPLDIKGLVYPAPESASFPLARAGTQEDGKEKSQDSGPDDFQGLAPYIPGNPMGRISWKTFSQGQGLFIKDFTAEIGRDILLDLALLRQGGLEKKLSMLCQGILEAEKKNLRYGLKLGQSFSTGPGRGTAHLHRCLKALALYNNPAASDPPGEGKL
jgi:uncharacterized protein (DUF58 family)